MHMCFAASVWLSGLEEELVVFLTLPHAVNSSRSRCIRPSRASSGFDEDFPTSGSPHLPARRRPALVFFSLFSWKLCFFFFLRSSQWSNPEIFVVLMRFKRCHRRNLLLKFQVKQLFENIVYFFPSETRSRNTLSLFYWSFLSFNYCFTSQFYLLCLKGILGKSFTHKKTVIWL